MLAVNWDTIRLFLHVLAATVWVGGQITCAASCAGRLLTWVPAPPPPGYWGGDHDPRRAAGTAQPGVAARCGGWPG